MKLLDHGSIELIESWGSDERIIEAARMSTDKGFQGWGGGYVYRCLTCNMGIHKMPNEAPPFSCDYCGDVSCWRVEEAKAGDEKLLRYLWEHKHLTPFEMAGAIFEVQAPIFVFREWHRHRTQSFNELSARYTPLPDVNYLPTAERLLMKSDKNKQAQSTGIALDEGDANKFIEYLEESYRRAQSVYETALNFGVPKELARLVIPVGRYSRMRASANLRNWLSFLTLRNDEAAQYEIQIYARAVQSELKKAFPRTLALFEEEQAVAT